MNKRIPILIGFFLLAFAIWVQGTSHESVKLVIQRFDNLFYDMQMRAQIRAFHRIENNNVAIIDIDDPSLAAYGRWPWPRSILAKLIQQLKADGVAVIAMDMLFPEQEANVADEVTEALVAHHIESPNILNALNQIKSSLDQDKIFADSFQNQDMVLGMTFLPRAEVRGTLPNPLSVLHTDAEKNMGLLQMSGYLSDIPILSNAAKNLGFLNVFPDSDGIIRRVPLVLRYQDGVYPSLALAAVNLYLLSHIELKAADYGKALQIESLTLGPHDVPVDQNANMLVRFVGKSFSFPYFSAAAVLQNKIAPDALQGKVVFIGTSAVGEGDLQATSVQGVFPGVEIQATIAYSILNDHYAYKPAWTAGAEIFITFALGFFAILIFPFLGPTTLSLSTILFPCFLIFANSLVWEKTGLVIFIFVPIILIFAIAITNMICGYLFETRRRQRLKEMFGQYVPAKHIDEMLKAKDTYALHGEDREMTVLFADIRNFTTISEPMTATELKDLLNAFFTPMTEIIFQHQGTIDKYIGDLIMAFWGAPLKDKKHAEHALQSALEMQVAVDKLKPIFKEKGWAEVNIGIGVNTGVMSVGDMGSQFRRNYTVLGDAVNLGSRVEGLSKFYGVKIIASEFACKDQTLFLFRQLDRVRVKGKKLGVNIFEVVGILDEVSEEKKKEMAESDAAFQAYLIQAWDQAETQFQSLQERYPHAELYPLYLERIQNFRKEPPPAEWDGVYIHTSK